MNVVCRVIIQVVLIHCGFASFYADAQESEFEGDKQYQEYVSMRKQMQEEMKEKEPRRASF